MTEDIFIIILSPGEVIIDLWAGASPPKNFCAMATGIKLGAIISIHSPNQEVHKYSQKHASILQAQKLYQSCPAKNTRCDYLALAQLDLIDTYFLKIKSVPHLFGLCVVRQANINICINHHQVVRFRLNFFCLVEQCLV